MSTPSALPAGARLLHVGPHKTGTTALQSAFHQARDEMREQGVRYASRGRHDAKAARFITDRLVAGTDPERAEKGWHGVRRRLTEETGDLRVFSSEFFSDATDEQMARIVEQIGAEDLWVAITLRPLAKILPSQYQQGLQRQSTWLYDEWLHSVLDEEPVAPGPRQFWLRHRHDELVRRWAGHVGAERVVVVVLDSRDHDFLPHTFEQLLGLEPETLAGKDAQENRSLTAAEAELLRRFNGQFTELGLQPDHYARMLRHLKNHLKDRVPGADEERLLTPDWAVHRANEVGREMADAIAALGSPVYGDLGSLSTAKPAGVEGTPEPPAVIDAGVAAWFSAGLALGADALVRAAAERVPAPAAAAAAPSPKGLRGRLSRRG